MTKMLDFNIFLQYKADKKPLLLTLNGPRVLNKTALGLIPKGVQQLFPLTFWLVRLPIN